MISLLLLAFLLQLVIHTVNSIGGTTLNSFLWGLWNKLPTSTASDYRQATKLRGEVVRLKRELNATSAQDQFAKWAKLQRQHDKAVAEHDKKTQDLRSFESTFNTVANTLRWIFFQGVRLVAQTYYQRTPMFWLPRGWIPHWAEWLLAFPRAPTGSVSVQVWLGACMAVIQLAFGAIGAVWALRIQHTERSTTGKGEPVKVPAGEPKKEL